MDRKNKTLSHIGESLLIVIGILTAGVVLALLSGCSVFKQGAPFASGNQIVLNGKPLDNVGKATIDGKALGSISDFKGLANVSIKTKNGKTYLNVTEARGTNQWILSVWTWAAVVLVGLGLLGLCLQKTLNIPTSASGRFIESGAIIGVSTWVTAAYGWIIALVACIGAAIAIARWINTHRGQIKAQLHSVGNAINTEIK